ncbi:ADP-ribosylglycohydrolase family protein [Anaerotruncus colihominis]|uniref:ADP-ribosylglycohydrolase family protein n=1 Tax=Anaerotruncus colihominis TaxID=169435 RepID=UPI00321A9DF5
MKKAWEWDYELFCSAVPVKNRTDLIEWDGLLEGKFLEEARQMLENGKGAWSKPLPESKAPYSKMLGAISSMANMGYEVSKAEALIPQAFDAIREERLIDLQIINARVFKYLAEAPKIPDHPYWSHTIYETFEQYLKNVRLEEYPDYTLPKREELFDRVHGGWLGEIIGSALGTAVEGFKSSRLWEVFGEIDGYVKPPETLNDDITFELALLDAFLEKGFAISSDDIADKWVGLIPFAYTAEEVALRHMRSGIYPPQSGYLVNPYREMIGAAMRAAVCGALAPGRPRLAAELAWKDGRVSHHNNGILAEVFNAVLVSMAYVEADMQTVLQKAMLAVPQDSELYTVLEFAFDACEKSPDYRAAWELCEERYKHYNWVHTYPNLASEVVAVYFAGNDYNKAMSILMMSGQDNDCTGGPVGHAYGAMLGASRLDKKFTEPLEDRLDTYVRTMETQSITSLSEKTMDAICRHWT